ncbi:unnamed protein product [Cladocopium goreaui]|uniref:Saccharopine dehydrogenase NADP binding domain-containing protein n=1 Tax=Cladocopium goreaui TaxID=2562237 RepID=A0A9P1BXM1_9DINO|nr:unnamed protein product [Cladocopium goreaui]
MAPGPKKIVSLEKGKLQPHEFDKYEGVVLETAHIQTPIEEIYFTGNMLSKYEACTDSLKDIINTDGDNEETWEKFDEHFTKFLNMSWATNWDGMRYDIVFYGVSGYTGYLMIQYLKRTALVRNREPFTFAFAGRTANKVRELRDREFAGTDYEDIPILQASYDDVFSLMDLCRSAHVIVNVAGPYMLTQGELLLDCCCRCGTDYCDVSGEIPWSHRTLALHEQARKNKVTLVPSAAVAGGYPDLLTFLLAKKLREEHGEELRRAIVYFNGGGAVGGASGGTLASRGAMSNASDETRKLMADPFALGGFIPSFDRNGMKEMSIQTGTGKVTHRVRREDTDAALSKVSQCPVTGIYRAPHMYSYFDTRIVRRSNALLADLANQPYGKEFNFQEFIRLPPEVAQQAASGTKAAGPSVADEKAALKEAGLYFAQGSGPDLNKLDDAWICLNCVAETTGGHQARCGVVGRDGYFETARCAIEMAMTLRFDKQSLPVVGGVLNATVVGQTWYADRLINSGVKWRMGGWFDFEEMTPPPY